MIDWKIGDLVQARKAYGVALVDLGMRREDVFVLDSDLQRSNQTYSFGQNFPERFLDIGIAEADMISTAAGIASMGFTVFAASFAMFLPGRCYDQIRLQVAYANSNVKLSGVSAGLTQGPDGASHQSIDDVALMRQLPGMTVVVPADAIETYQAVQQVADLDGPVYLRLGRYPSPVIYDQGYKFEVGKANVLSEGDDVALFSTGIMVAKAMEASKMLEKDGVQASVINISTIKPIDRETILEQSQGKKLVVSLEEHSILGGLGSAVAETLAEAKSTPPLLRIGVNDRFGQSATADELLDEYGLSAPKITDSIRKAIF